MNNQSNRPAEFAPPPLYLCYDVKGIQQFIFSVPKLKYVVGASLLIDGFDRDAPELAQENRSECVFCGGGKGTFRCVDRQEAERLRLELVRQAHKIGLDLRIGLDESLSEASRRADDLYPFVPESLDGEPCAVSRLWPVPIDQGETLDQIPGIHRVVALRAKAVRANRNFDSSNRLDARRSPNGSDSFDDPSVFKNRVNLDSEILDAIRERLPAKLRELTDRFRLATKNKRSPLEFLTVVRASDELDDDEFRIAVAADRALGSRNRWAVLSMDGNDMGRQFRAFETKKTSISDDSNGDSTGDGDGRFSTDSAANQNGDSTDESEKLRWLKEASRSLRDCTRKAFEDGLVQAIDDWQKDVLDDRRLWETFERAQTVVLPFRPLILGGDDVLCLCHCSYALTMAKTIIRSFSRRSEEAAKKAKEKMGIERLWPGTGNRLTISAGIVYSGVTTPLFSSIPYAESLLGLAKSKFRQTVSRSADFSNSEATNSPTPAAVDWESITETFIDSPLARRKRDLTFFDSDCDETVVLTDRPYLVPLDDDSKNDSRQTSLKNVEDLKDELREIPRSILMELTSVLKLPWGERTARLAAMAVRDRRILNWLGDDYFANQPFGSQFAAVKPNSESFGKCWIRESPQKRRNWFLDAICLLEEERRMEKETV